jgi:hypothetical protein
MRLLSLMLLLIAAILQTGCASTQRFEHPYSGVGSSQETATIRIVRSPIVGAIAAALVRDGDVPIGLLGAGDEIFWKREPGFVAVLCGWRIDGSDKLNHAIIFPVQGGKTYTIRLSVGGGAFLTPLNFAQEQIAFEERSAKGGLSLPTVGISADWKAELERLNGKK